MEAVESIRVVNNDRSRMTGEVPGLKRERLVMNSGGGNLGGRGFDGSGTPVGRRDRFRGRTGGGGSTNVTLRDCTSGRGGNSSIKLTSRGVDCDGRLIIGIAARLANDSSRMDSSPTSGGVLAGDRATGLGSTGGVGKAPIRDGVWLRSASDGVFSLTRRSVDQTVDGVGPCEGLPASRLSEDCDECFCLRSSLKKDSRSF